MSERDASTFKDGTQAIRRAAGILQCIARVSEGAPPTLREISESVDLPRSTTHRILKCLSETGLASYDEGKRLYEIGPLCYELGLAVSERVLDIGPLCTAVDRITTRINVTTYLMRRSGIHAVCIHKAEGNSVIRVIPVEVGQRRFLGVGAGATALLAALDDEAVAKILDAVAPELAGYANLDAEAIRDAVAAARSTGFATSHSRVYKSVFGLAQTIPAQGTASEFAISIAVHAPDVDEPQIARWRAVLAEEIAAAATSRRSKTGT